jgi:hypothetical protein
MTRSLELSNVRRSSAYRFGKHDRFHYINSMKANPGPGDYKWNDTHPKKGGLLSDFPSN